MGETVFHQMDRMRRWGGDWLEILSLPREEQPHVVILEAAGVRLREYRGPESGPVLFIVPAPIKRHYIWDLTAETSVVAHAVAEGFRVFLAEWTEAPANYGVADYADLLGRCMAQIRKRSRQRPHVATHSLGGILGVAYAALHPADVKSLVLIETPLHFGEGSDPFGPLLAAGPSGGEIAAQFGSVPGSFLSTVAVTACPAEFEFERYADWAACALDAKNLDTHMRVERWAMDEFPLPGTLYVEVVDQLYRQDLLMRGEFTVGMQRIGPGDLRLPLLFVSDPRCRVVPPESIVPFHAAAASTDKLLLPYRGEVGVALRHVGALVGRHAHQELWPQIFAWLRKKRPTSRAMRVTPR